MKEDDTIIGQGMVMTKNVGGMWEPIRDRRLERRVNMLTRAFNGDFSQLEAKLATAKAELAKAEKRWPPCRGSIRKGTEKPQLKNMRQMVKAYERIIEAYKSGAA